MISYNTYYLVVVMLIHGILDLSTNETNYDNIFNVGKLIFQYLFINSKYDNLLLNIRYFNLKLVNFTNTIFQILYTINS